MQHSDRIAQVTKKFQDQFGHPPQVWARAPGRVDLMGSHTDYNMGYVMTMTVDRDTWVAASPRSDRKVCIYSMNAAGGGEFSLDEITPDSQWKWTNYVRGMAKTMQEAGYPLCGMNMLVHSTVPFGSGLSSSAALEMAVGTIFQLVCGFPIEPIQLALLGQRAENQFVGVNCGILDQYSSAMGKEGCALLLDCRSLASTTVPIAPGIQVMICDTCTERNLAGTEYGERRAQCEEGAHLLRKYDPNVQALRDVSQDLFRAYRHTLPPLVAKRCEFIIEENQRVLALGKALAQGDHAAIQALTRASFAGARDLYEISAPSMEMMMEAMTNAPGIIGARQAGAGFGGCMVALVHSDQADEFTRHVIEDYRTRSGITARIHLVRPSAGAGALVVKENTVR